LAVRCAERALGPAIGDSRLAAAAAQEQAAVTWDVLDQLIATCPTDRLADTRGLAILLLTFASGGRRRNDVARLRVARLRDNRPARPDPYNAKSPTPPCLAIQLGRTKTGDVDEEGRVILVGPPVEALREWLERAGIKTGRISGDRPLGSRGGKDAHAAVDQSDRKAAVRQGRAGAGGAFRARTARRICDRGGAAGDRAAGGDAAVPAPVCPAGVEPLQ
jgi:hypothetical protein